MQRRKGKRVELETMHALRDAGFDAQKISRAYCSGPDLRLKLVSSDFRVEVKARADGFKQLYDWLAKADMVVMRADSKKPIVALSWDMALALFRSTFTP